jgi:hypothetical protein
MEDGMRFLQFYFGLPLAMIIISVTMVPIYYRLKVFTAYEYLETRFDLKVRTTCCNFIFDAARPFSRHNSFRACTGVIDHSWMEYHLHYHAHRSVSNYLHCLWWY